MSGSFYRRLDFFESPSSIFHPESSIFGPDFPFFAEDHIELADLLDPILHFPIPHPPFLQPNCSSPLGEFDIETHLIQIDKTPLSSSYRRIHYRSGPAVSFQSLTERVSGLDLRSNFDPVVGRSKVDKCDRNYGWTAEIKSPGSEEFDRKYERFAETRRKAGGRKYETWTDQISGVDGHHVSRGGVRIRDWGESSGVEYSSNAGKGGDRRGPDGRRTIKIEDPQHRRISTGRQAYGKKTSAVAKAKGKRKILSPQDAAMMIQTGFRDFLSRRSHALRSVRELAAAKAKLKELRAMFNNFSYRRLIARDAEERQRFSERVIVLLLTIDGIEGVDLVVRAAKKKMVDELEAMLDVVDPRPSGKCLGSMRRRKFDMPVADGGLQNEIAAGVAEVVQMLDQGEKYENDTFEVCL